MIPKIKIFLPFFLIFSTIISNFFIIDFSEAEDKPSFKITRSQVKQIEKHLLEQQEELLSVDIKEKGILRQIERLEKDMALNRESLKGLSSEIKKVSREIQGGQRRIQQLNRSSSTVKECLKKRLVAFYKFGRLGYARLLATSDNIQEFQRTIRYMKVIMDQDRQILDMLGRQKRQVERELEVLMENKAKIKVLEKAKDRRMALLEKDIEKKVFLLMKVHREKEFYTTAVKELKEASKALSETMIHLEAEEEGGQSGKGFFEMKGKLPLPLKGEILVDLKQFRSNPFIHRKGIYIKGPPGEKVRSIFPGKVDYSGWFKGYGQLVIINHGSHYFSLFAHLDERVKEKGEMVSGGEEVGLVGDFGWQGGTGLYFEIRKGGDHLDPKKWLKIK